MVFARYFLAYEPLLLLTAYFEVHLMMQPNMQYACRKTLADSRPRVRGRFAKNDDFGDSHRTASGNHEEEDEEEVAISRNIQLLY